MSWWLPWTARYRGVLQSLVWVSTSTPFSMSTLTTLIWPLDAATCMGAQLSDLVWLGFPPEKQIGRGNSTRWLSFRVPADCECKKFRQILLHKPGGCFPRGCLPRGVSATLPCEQNHRCLAATTLRTVITHIEIYQSYLCARRKSRFSCNIVLNTIVILSITLLTSKGNEVDQ